MCVNAKHSIEEQKYAILPTGTRLPVFPRKRIDEKLSHIKRCQHAV